MTCDCRTSIEKNGSRVIICSPQPLLHHAGVFWVPLARRATKLLAEALQPKINHPPAEEAQGIMSWPHPGCLASCGAVWEPRACPGAVPGSILILHLADAALRTHIPLLTQGYPHRESQHPYEELFTSTVLPFENSKQLPPRTPGVSSDVCYQLHFCPD